MHAAGNRGLDYLRLCGKIACSEFDTENKKRPQKVPLKTECRRGLLVRRVNKEESFDAVWVRVCVC